MIHHGTILKIKDKKKIHKKNEACDRKLFKNIIKHHVFKIRNIFILIKTPFLINKRTRLA